MTENIFVAILRVLCSLHGAVDWWTRCRYVRLEKITELVALINNQHFQKVLTEKQLDESHFDIFRIPNKNTFLTRKNFNIRRTIYRIISNIIPLLDGVLLRDNSTDTTGS